MRLGDPAGQHEQGIAQAIEELEHDGVHRLFARKSHADSFRRAANRPRLVQQPRNLAASRQDELFERSQVFLTFVDELFQTSDILGCHLGHVFESLTRSSRQDTARVEQFILDPSEFFLQTGRRSVCADFLGVKGSDDTHRRVQLVYDPVGLDPQTVLPDLLPSGEPRFPGIAGARIHLRNPHSNCLLRDGIALLMIRAHRC